MKTFLVFLNYVVGVLSILMFDYLLSLGNILASVIMFVLYLFTLCFMFYLVIFKG